MISAELHSKKGETEHSKKSSSQCLEEGMPSWSTGNFGGSESFRYDTVTADTHHDTLVEAHRMCNAEHETYCEL